MKIFRSAFRQRILKTARLVAYAIVASLVCAALASRVAYADLLEGSLYAGRELEELGDVVGTAKTVFINGAAMNVSTAFTDQAPGEVLDRFEALCKEHPEFLVRALADVPATLLQKAKVTPDRLWRLGVVRKESGDDGALTCFTDDRPASFRDLIDRLKAFERSKDLAEFGRFRYIYVRRTDRGTHVRTVWTEGAFNVDQMFPAQGDAAGFDSTDVPRPPSAKRTLSATSAQVPDAIHAYRSSESRESLRRFYDQEMSARGWKRASDDWRQDTSVYLKNGAMCFVTLVAKRGVTLVATTETARSDTPTEARVHLAN